MHGRPFFLQPALFEPGVYPSLPLLGYKRDISFDGVGPNFRNFEILNPEPAKAVPANETMSIVYKAASLVCTALSLSKPLSPFPPTFRINTRNG